ncbi:cytochrome c [Geomonas subterranea]|uniref:Cytochrome c n=1 Tax=Geomonas subterranea TaxID=2847989 RepID=A0ABX8LR27_9BACT|nr:MULTISPECIES: cytochrome c [Geomonas]QXE91980.1 cytochrome c [Geomonas subterranea]QXM09927.1 cytochrome c [Geomonas subterranea]
MKTFILAAAAALLLVSAVAYAHQEQHHGDHQGAAQMAKLHKMMPGYAKARALIEKSLEQGDLKGAVTQTDYLLSTTADLKKSTPHKNVERIKEFQGIASDFEQDVNALAAAAKKGDLKGARGSFTSAAKRCNSCHAKFRT